MLGVRAWVYHTIHSLICKFPGSANPLKLGNLLHLLVSDPARVNQQKQPPAHRPLEVSQDSVMSEL